eukprot:Colp12_sorted_trinity150504_noHs@33776
MIPTSTQQKMSPCCGLGNNELVVLLHRPPARYVFEGHEIKEELSDAESSSESSEDESDSEGSSGAEASDEEEENGEEANGVDETEREEVADAEAEVAELHIEAEGDEGTGVV